jgi:general secretion pathway protein H
MSASTFNSSGGLGRLRRGFSLLEMTLVVAILAVTAGLAAPRYALAVDRYRADAAARKIAADIRWAHSRAIAVGGTRVVSFDTATSSYSIAGETNPDRPGNAFLQSLSSGPWAASIVSVTFSGSGATFNGFGVCTAGGTVVIQSGSCKKTIQIDAPTGAVTIR